MKLGIDIRPLQRETRFRGIGKHLEELLLAMSKIDQDNEYVFFVEKDLPVPEKLIRRFSNYQIKYIPAYYLNRIRIIRAFAPANKIIRTNNNVVDVIFESDGSYGVPKSVPSVLVFHDAIPLIFRGDDIYKPRGLVKKLRHKLVRILYDMKYKKFLGYFKSASHIISISKHSQTDLWKYIPETKKIPNTVIYHGSTTHIKSKAEITAPKKVKTNDKFLLYVGGIDHRKNLIGMAREFVNIKAKYPELKLVVVGKEFNLKIDLENIGWYKALGKYEKDVIYTGFVTSGQLTWLYEHAVVFIFTSLYEGFGLPILEAMKARCPVICYNNSSLPEVAGNAALVVPDGKPMTEAIDKILSDNNLRNQLVTKGIEQSKKFTWENSAKQTIDVLVKTAKDD